MFNPKDSTYITFDSLPSFIRKKDILHTQSGDFLVLKVYRRNWWRLLLRRLKLKVKMDQVRVKRFKPQYYES